jgi:hypothetical protein
LDRRFDLLSRAHGEKLRRGRSPGKLAYLCLLAAGAPRSQGRSHGGAEV